MTIVVRAIIIISMSKRTRDATLADDAELLENVAEAIEDRRSAPPRAALFEAIRDMFVLPETLLNEILQHAGDNYNDDLRSVSDVAKTCRYFANVAWTTVRTFRMDKSVPAVTLCKMKNLVCLEVYSADDISVYEGLSELKHLRELVVITSWKTPALADAHLVHLARLHKLTLWGDESAFTNTGFAALTALQSLRLDGTVAGLTNNGLAALTTLRTLFIGDNPHITSAGLCSLGKQLEFLDTGWASITPDVFVHLTNLQVLILNKLESDDMMEERLMVTDADLVPLRNLQVLDFRNSGKRIRGTCFKHMPHLLALTLPASKNATNFDVSSLVALQELEYLHVPSSSAAGNELDDAILNALPKLRVLSCCRLGAGRQPRYTKPRHVSIDVYNRFRHNRFYLDDNGFIVTHYR